MTSAGRSKMHNLRFWGNRYIPVTERGPPAEIDIFAIHEDFTIKCTDLIKTWPRNHHGCATHPTDFGNRAWVVALHIVHMVLVCRKLIEKWKVIYKGRPSENIQVGWQTSALELQRTILIMEFRRQNAEIIQALLHASKHRGGAGWPLPELLDHIFDGFGFHKSVGV